MNNDQVGWKAASFRLSEAISNLSDDNCPDYFYNYNPSQILDYALPILQKLYEEKNK